MDDVKRHKSAKEDWTARKAAWRQLRHDHAILTLKSYLHSPEVIAPQSQAEALQALAASQAAFQERRVAVSEQLGASSRPRSPRPPPPHPHQLEELLVEEAAAAGQLRGARHGGGGGER